MTLNTVEFILVLIGLAVTPLAFYHIPKLPEFQSEAENFKTVSIIIPARNEEKNLPLLLEDLKSQLCVPFEVICVDDESSDLTAHIASSYGIKVISLHEKPSGWTGKTWACQNGANAATGDLLLFLDADVRLEQNGVLRLIQAQANCDCPISVQPYHKTEKAYEQISVLFNLIQVAANGIALPKSVGTGLFGPIILISKSDYDRIGGHESVSASVVEDLSLGCRLKDAGIPYQLYIGDREISFRMYGSGIRSLFQGWIKNIGTCAVHIPRLILLMVFFIITSLASVPFHVITFAGSKNILWLVIYSSIYIVWVFILYFYSKQLGQFRLLSIVFYPVSLLGFIWVFAVSLMKWIFRMQVLWKGRAIVVREKPCR